MAKSERVLRVGRDLFEEVKKEIREEIGITIENNDDIQLKKGYLTENFNVCFLFVVFLSLTFAEVKELFAGYNDGEAKNIIGISKNAPISSLSFFEPKDIIKFKIFDFI